MTIKEKIGQRFIIGIDNENIDDIIYLICEYAIGGVILYKKNYTDYSEMIEIIKKIKKANKNNKLPLFIAIDQEGGRVNRFPKEIVNLKNMYELSKKDKALVYEGAKVLGNILKNSGINMNFAPVMDICDYEKSNILYKRCFYGNVDDVSECSKIYVNAMKEENVLAVGKHFPGHGISDKDSHFWIPYVINYKSVLDRHIKPFYNNKDIDGMMLGHIIIRKLTGLLPASISRKFIDNYVRNYYDGLIVTDEIKMLSRNIFYRYNYLKKAREAHEDIILVKINSLKTGIRIMNKANKLFLNDEKLDESVNRIIDMKKKYKISDDCNFKGIDIDKVNDKITKINDKVNNFTKDKK